MSSPSRRPYGRHPSSEDEAELGSSKRVLAEHARRSRSRSRQRASTAVGSSSPTIDNNANTLSQSSSHLALSEARRRGRSVSRQRLDSSSHSKNAAPPIRGRSSSRSGGGGRISSAGLSSLKDQLASFETPKRTSSGLKYPSSLYFEAARGLSSGDDSLQSSESSSHHGGGGLASFLTPPVSTNQNRTQLNSLHAAATSKHHHHQGTSSDDSDNQSLADFWQDEEHQEGGEAQEKPSSKATTNFARQTSLDSSQSSFMGGTSWNPTSFYQNQLHQHMDEVEDTY
ncbi:expressed unknown protein [Seminavis robusta]|uniref:Uncharacterized protein n=1 Tax=Seminavis robusta TaxID=568900 RepID=A0A9N8I1A9_9STRA|nr:expressed unknown protein [Seminavis robusta]|eukprot:Sro3324_g346800.1 n/a (284) ;mRNA; r:147-998